MIGSIDWLGVLAAGIAGYIFGAVYYTVLGTQWMAALGTTKEEIEKRKSPAPFVIAAIGQFVLAVTLSILAGAESGTGPMLALALLLWIGIVMTTMTINHSFQGNKPALTIIDGLHWLGVLMLQSVVLSLV
ncbi:DUF1761 domain-containing protein [Pacificispira sp.]|uniref:DUF1761 domain-containing protein n=1 Tax=Pacificispira sp. TaxID=2888761 RepID=UPI003BACB1D4